jgi:hypothetical protein
LAIVWACGGDLLAVARSSLSATLPLNVLRLSEASCSATAVWKAVRSAGDIFFDCGSISSMLMWTRRPRRCSYRADAPASLAMKLLKSLNAVYTLLIRGILSVSDR